MQIRPTKTPFSTSFDLRKRKEMRTKVSVTRKPSGQVGCDALCGWGCVFSGFGREVPGEQLANAVDGLIGDARQNVA